MARLGEVAVWSFHLKAWGECAQASSEADALESFRRRVGIQSDELHVAERITGPSAIFSEDLAFATERQIERTIHLLQQHRVQTLALFKASTDEDLDARDETTKQPPWMTWRTPRQILRHIADTEARAYPRRCGLPQLDPIDDLRTELDLSARHILNVIQTMPRFFRTENREEIWTPVKLLRRLAWHERIELIFLRRRLHG